MEVFASAADAIDWAIIKGAEEDPPKIIRTDGDNPLMVSLIDLISVLSHCSPGVASSRYSNTIRKRSVATSLCKHVFPGHYRSTPAATAEDCIVMVQKMSSGYPLLDQFRRLCVNLNAGQKESEPEDLLAQYKAETEELREENRLLKQRINVLELRLFMREAGLDTDCQI